MSFLAHALVFEEMLDEQVTAVFPEDVTAAVDLLRAEVDSIEPDADEQAHQMESFLHRNVLRVIASGHIDNQQLAEMALTSERIGFPRFFG